MSLSGSLQALEGSPGGVAAGAVVCQPTLAGHHPSIPSSGSGRRHEPIGSLGEVGPQRMRIVSPCYGTAEEREGRGGGGQPASFGLRFMPPERLGAIGDRHHDHDGSRSPSPSRASLLLPSCGSPCLIEPSLSLLLASRLPSWTSTPSPAPHSSLERKEKRWADLPKFVARFHRGCPRPTYCT